jgi:hypothetical protein
VGVRAVSGKEVRRGRPGDNKMSEQPHHSPRANRTKSFFVRQSDGSLRCPTCAKERVDCLRWNAEDGVFEYRLRKPSHDEQVTSTTHPEIGAVRIMTKWAMYHGSRYEVIAERILCAAGIMIVTDWSSSSIRAYGSQIPGRLGLKLRGGKGTGGRRPPIPLKFYAATVYGWIFRFLVQIPKNPEEFLRLMAVCSRLVDDGLYERGALVEYSDELCHFFNWWPPASDH